MLGSMLDAAIRCFYNFQEPCILNSGVGGGGESAPQRFWFVENPGKIRENLGKIYDNVRKIPEILGKLPGNTDKNGKYLKNLRPTWGESNEIKWRLVLEATQKKIFIRFLRED